MRTALTLTLALLVSIMLGLCGVWLGLAPQDAELQQLRAHQAPAASDHDRLQISWHGVSAILIRDREHALFIDPFFSRPPGLLAMLGNRDIAPDPVAIRNGLEQAGVQSLDAVLVSHSHFDHAMDAGFVAALSGADLIGSSSTLNIGRGAGLAETRLFEAAEGQLFQYGAFRLRFVRSRHAGATGGRPQGEISLPLTPPAGYLDYREGGSYSILIEHPQLRLLHHASAGFAAEALRPFQADVALLGVALVDDWAVYLQQTADAVGADTLIPLHWDDFTRPLSQPLRPMPFAVQLDALLAHLRTRPDLQLLSLPLAQPVHLN